MPLSTLTQLRIDVDALALETGNMTETERAKLAGIEEGAAVPLVRCIWTYGYVAFEVL